MSLRPDPAGIAVPASGEGRGSFCHVVANRFFRSPAMSGSGTARADWIDCLRQTAAERTQASAEGRRGHRPGHYGAIAGGIPRGVEGAISATFRVGGIELSQRHPNVVEPNQRPAIELSIAWHMFDGACVGKDCAFFVPTQQVVASQMLRVDVVHSQALIQAGPVSRLAMCYDILCCRLKPLSPMGTVSTSAHG